MFDDALVVYKCLGDLMFYVTGGQEESELILYSVLQAFYESVSILLRQQVDKKTVLENLDLVLLAIDEIIDRGCAFVLRGSPLRSARSRRSAPLRSARRPPTAPPPSCAAPLPPLAHTRPTHPAPPPSLPPLTLELLLGDEPLLVQHF